MYDAFSSDYDRFVDWDGRLAFELSFLERQLLAARARRVLDVACGTGMHAVALAQRGYDVVGADLSAAMIGVARANAAAAGVAVRFEAAGFGELRARLGDGFDAVLCLGNSLPHVLSHEALAAALEDLAGCLRRGGIALVQNRNFDRVLERRERWMEPQAHREGDAEWLFLRFYDFNSDETLTFNLVMLKREGASDWQQQVWQTRLRPWRQRELLPALEAAGFGPVTCWGDMQGAPYRAEDSPNLVLVASRV